jgi:DNA polymerase elongation subunit (family B)
MSKTAPKKLVVTKQFRLIDYHTYDESPQHDDSSDSGEDGRPKSYGDENQFVIQMFGINEKGETCCIYIQDFQPFFFVRVAPHWTNSEKTAFHRELQNRIGKRYKDSILDVELMECQKLYGFTAGQQDKFIKLTFKNTTTMNRVKNMWYVYTDNAVEGGDYKKRKDFIFLKTNLELYESNIPPLLRYFHIHNISPTGWVSFKTNRVSAPARKTTTCDYEYVCPVAELKPLPDKETIVPYKICSFDIEASSSHGDFPVPVKTYKRLVTNLVDTFIRQTQSQKIDMSSSKTLFQKVVLTAFGYDKFEDVDLVYPKKTPTKDRVKQLLDTLMNQPIEKAKVANQEEDNSYLLTIDMLFEQMKENQDVEGSGGGDDDHQDQGQSPEITYSYGKRSIKKVKLDRSATILDVLLSDSYERDDKIQIINDVMTRLFPRLEGDKVTFIGSTFMRYGDKEPYMNHCVVLNSCDPVEGAVIETADTETDVLMKWAQLIQRENPDIIIGYNIFGFDYEFMFRRAQETGCVNEFLKLSRKINELCAKYDKTSNDYVIENTKLSVASGEYDLRYFKMTGRLQIDMYAYFRRDFNLSSYKLDDVACQFISDDILKIVRSVEPIHGNVTELYSKNLMGLHTGDFIHIEMTGFTSDYFNDGQKFQVLDIKQVEVMEMIKGKEQLVAYNAIIIAGHHDIDTKKSLKWGTAKDDVTPQDIFRLTKGSSADRAIVAKYCIQDCNLVQHLMNKIDVITGFVEMAKICSVPVSFLVFRGQGIKLTSFVAKKCREKNMLMPDLEKESDGGGYEGAIVLPPKCSIYMDNPVACVDYSSLYPSSMISQNLSHDSKVWTKEYDLEDRLIRVTGEQDKMGAFIYDNLPGYEYIDLEFDTYKYVRKTPTSKAEKTKSGRMICRWAQFPADKKGIMPSILEELLKARKDTRNRIKTEKDPFMQNILDKRQLGYKVTANSLYGQCGSRTSTFYEKDIAACTTATGRMMILYAKRIIEEVYGDMIYETALHGPVKTKAEYIYGDSVANYTPVYVRKNGVFDICTIEDLCAKYGTAEWTPCSEEGKQEKEVCELTDVETWTERGWTRLYRVIRHVLAPHKKMIRVLTHTGLVDVTDDHSLLHKDGTEVSPKDVKVGCELLHHPLPPEFGQDFYSGSIAMNHRINSTDQHVKLARQCAYVQSQGLSMRFTSPHDLVFRWVEPYSPDVNNIIQMNEIPYTGYVYDLTTENHHFAAGIGNLIVHNTDSVFFTFNLENPETGEKIRGKPALEMTIEIAQDAAHLCTQHLKAPMELSYEKTLMPFILVRKKKYVGMLYETDANKGKMKIMGLSVKRRDTCDYFKDVYGGVLKTLMDSNVENNIKTAIEFTERSLNELIEGRVPMDKLTITKALRSDYKNPHTIAHKVLADRIGKRDPGNKPKPGDRIKFVAIVNETPRALMGDKIETPEFIKENKLKIDYNYYITNQLMKPLQQLFGLALEQIWEYQNKKPAIKTFRTELAKIQKEVNDDLEEFIKKKEKLCSTQVKKLLFDKVLTKIQNEKNGIQAITAFYTRR